MSRRSSARAARLAQAASLGGATQHDLRTFWTSCRLCRLAQSFPHYSVHVRLYLTHQLSRDAAVTAYLAAANRTTNTAERNYLLTQAAAVREGGAR